ncbi:hypothetical protein [Hoeflea sp. 108]|uniref:hypothetical protein n=1 Tax=Hoeflea sp. 108 TaxID=1116369 RepID=UPI0012FBC3BE|nr:hypothetical protein [Hoeflea sp. 108]
MTLQGICSYFVPMSNLPDVQWRHTWDDDLDREDYSAFDGRRRVGRIYSDSIRGERYWRWFPAWGGARGADRCESRAAAMMALESAYLEVLERHPNPAKLFHDR